MIRIVLVALCLAGPVQAQSVAEAARAAAGALADARGRLDRATGARDQVAALTETIRAYEAGLAALRQGLRAATIRETELTRALNAREDDVSRLLGALQAIAGVQGVETSLHPDGPLASVRAGMLVASVAPGLGAEAQALRRDLDEVAALRQVQQDAVGQLQDGLAGVQQARLDLSQAVAARTDLPQRFTADPVRTAILLGAAETLDAFARDLDQISAVDIVPLNTTIDASKGRIALPVNGTLLRRAGEADAAGVARPGIVLATGPQALVTTPVPVTLRYRGPLLDYGLVAILEPQPDLLFVLAGLGEVYGEIGDVLPAGSPVGLMGGSVAGDPLAVSQSGERAGTARPETLYIEVRQGNTPVDPLTLFSTDKG